MRFLSTLKRLGDEILIANIQCWNVLYIPCYTQDIVFGSITVTRELLLCSMDVENNWRVISCFCSVCLHNTLFCTAYLSLLITMLVLKQNKRWQVKNLLFLRTCSKDDSSVVSNRSVLCNFIKRINTEKTSGFVTVFVDQNLKLLFPV